MKAGLATLMVSLSAFSGPAFSALPASAREASSQPVALSTADLPLTDHFASLLTSYRNCVLAEVDAAPLGVQQEMARDAISACSLSRTQLRAQLVSDIRASRPRTSSAIALRSAESGMAQVDPMIEAAAVDWVHLRYASNML